MVMRVCQGFAGRKEVKEGGTYVRLDACVGLWHVVSLDMRLGKYQDNASIALSSVICKELSLLTSFILTFIQRSLLLAPAFVP